VSCQVAELPGYQFGNLANWATRQPSIAAPIRRPRHRRRHSPILQFPEQDGVDQRLLDLRMDQSRHWAAPKRVVTVLGQPRRGGFGQIDRTLLISLDSARTAARQERDPRSDRNPPAPGWPRTVTTPPSRRPMSRLIHSKIKEPLVTPSCSGNCRMGGMSSSMPRATIGAAILGCRVAQLPGCRIG